MNPIIERAGIPAVACSALLGVMVIWKRWYRQPKKSPRPPKKCSKGLLQPYTASDSWIKRLGMALLGPPEVCLYISSSGLPYQAPSILRHVRRLRRIGYQVQVRPLPEPCNSVEDMLLAMCREAQPEQSSRQMPKATNDEAKHNALPLSLL